MAEGESAKKKSKGQVSKDKRIQLFQLFKLFQLIVEMIQSSSYAPMERIISFWSYNWYSFLRFRPIWRHIEGMIK